MPTSARVRLDADESYSQYDGADAGEYAADVSGITEFTSVSRMLLIVGVAQRDCF